MLFLSYWLYRILEVTGEEKIEKVYEPIRTSTKRRISILLISRSFRNNSCDKVKNNRKAYFRIV